MERQRLFRRSSQKAWAGVAEAAGEADWHVLGDIFYVCDDCVRWGGEAGRFSLLKFLIHIKEEVLLVLATSSSETAIPTLMEKLEVLGCSRSLVGLIVPTGYTFNTDGSA